MNIYLIVNYRVDSNFVNSELGHIFAWKIPYYYEL